MHDTGMQRRLRVISRPARRWFATFLMEELSPLRQSAKIAKSCARPFLWKARRVRRRRRGELGSVRLGADAAMWVAAGAGRNDIGSSRRSIGSSAGWADPQLCAGHSWRLGSASVKNVRFLVVGDADHWTVQAEPRRHLRENKIRFRIGTAIFPILLRSPRVGKEQAERLPESHPTAFLELLTCHKARISMTQRHDSLRFMGESYVI